MEALIRFLLDNMILVIIVLGVLSSLFGRTGRQGGGGRMPDFGGGPGGGVPPGRSGPGNLRPRQGVPGDRRAVPGDPRARREAGDSQRPGDAADGSYRPGDATAGPYRAGEAPGRPHRAGGDRTAAAPGRTPEPPRQDASGFPGERGPGRRTDDRGQDVYADVRPGGTPSPVTHRPAGTAPAAPAPSLRAASSPQDPTAARAAEASRIAPALEVEERPARTVFGRDELRRAVIWAEILGPPRALRPHGRRRAGR
jgi:hypothetical protein